LNANKAKAGNKPSKKVWQDYEKSHAQKFAELKHFTGRTEKIKEPPELLRSGSFIG
jgi:hypothetical protein